MDFFVELYLKPYACPSQSTRLQRNRLLLGKSALLLKMLLSKSGSFRFFPFLVVFSDVYEKLPP